MNPLNKLPRLEELESRDVPSTLAAAFPGHGVWAFYPPQSWVQLTPSNASLVATDSNEDVVAEFPGQGVWLYGTAQFGGPHTWQQLTANNAAGLGIGYFRGEGRFQIQYQVTYVVAEFPGQGLWRYQDDNYSLDPFQGWQQLTANNASTEAISPNGDVVAEFPGQGVWLYGGATWKQLTASDATSVAINAPESPWVSTTPPMTGVSVIAAAFPGYGVWRMPYGGGWVQLTAADAASVGVGRNGDVVGEFSGHGVWSFTDSAAAVAAGWHAGWNQLTAADAALVGIDSAGNVYGQFPGWGVWYDQVYSWQQLTANNASSFGAGG